MRELIGLGPTVGVVFVAWATMLLTCTSVASAVAQAIVQPPVWLNSSSGVYHCKGTRFYGQTRAGAFVSEAEALRQGHRAARGRPCDARLDARAFASSSITFPPPERDEPRAQGAFDHSCVVEQIVDGDTIRCRGLGLVRLIGIDAPEMDHGRLGAVARAALTSLAPPGSTIELETDTQGRDRYRRMLAYAWAGGRQINFQMIRAGWAVLATYPPNVRYVESFTRGQRRAREAELGFWSRT